MVTEEYVKNYAISKLQELMVSKPKAQIFVIDKVFTPSELIEEILRGSKYGKAYIKIFRKHLEKR